MRHIRMITEPRVLTPGEVEALAARLAALCTAQPVVLLYLHGSHVRGTQGPLSDLDVAVLLEQPAARGLAVLDLLSALQEACRRDDVDLVVLNTAGPIIRDRVVRHGRLIYARSEADRIRFEAAAIKEALDFRFFSRVYDDALFRQLREGRFLD
jgi:hypothetical protein